MREALIDGLDVSEGGAEGQPAGGTQNRFFQFSFNSSLRVDFQGARVTSDGDLILVRELNERLGLSALMERHPLDSLRGQERSVAVIRPAAVDM